MLLIRGFAAPVATGFVFFPISLSPNGLQAGTLPGLDNGLVPPGDVANVAFGIIDIAELFRSGKLTSGFAVRGAAVETPENFLSSQLTR